MSAADIPEDNAPSPLLGLGLGEGLGPLVEATGMVNLLNHGAASCVHSEGCHGVTQEHLERFAELVRAKERQRLCAAIKAEDDYCVTQGDYMLDSDDCISVIRGTWVRPEYALGPNVRAKPTGAAQP